MVNEQVLSSGAEFILLYQAYWSFSGAGYQKSFTQQEKNLEVISGLIGEMPGFLSYKLSLGSI